MENEESFLESEESFSAFKREIYKNGICLGNMHSYGSASKLRSALRKNKGLVVNKNDAKRYKYVKMCLVNLVGA